VTASVGTRALLSLLPIAVVGLVGREGAAIRLTLWPFLYCALLPGTIGYSIVWSTERRIVNLGTPLTPLIAAAAVVIVASPGRRRPVTGDPAREDS
jgi:lactate permease